ncbi:hypothetical protein XF35_15010 [Streptomyces platensis subsp. clarensis]|nr:hypothetical protein [Streptomyces platensis subsp. clarensis]
MYASPKAGGGHERDERSAYGASPKTVPGVDEAARHRQCRGPSRGGSSSRGPSRTHSRHGCHRSGRRRHTAPADRGGL